MTAFLYRLLEGGADLLGPWFLSFSARIIAAGYFLFSPLRRESIRFYRLLYPERCKRSRLWPWYCTFQQYQHFTRIHCDRFLARSQHDLGKGTGISFSSEGLEQLDPLLDQQGALLLMSHLGNWEIAAELLVRQFPNMRLLLFMGAKQREGVEAAQKEALRRGGVRILALEEQEDNPLLAIEGIRFLQQGGVVSMPGDILLKPEQKRLEVSFLGGVARLPAAPFVMAMLTGAPIFVFFAFRTGPGHYHFTLSQPLHLDKQGRGERDQTLQQAAQHYAHLLEGALRNHPFAWFHFRRFVHDPPGATDAKRSGPRLHPWHP
ncbi:MAG: lysophospholipid acyltransferase family protein [Desulfobulbaceae bacterium]|nr:lysophospholipid acyltransferase family protein [Desulfobulbaceae bacterium]